MADFHRHVSVAISVAVAVAVSVKIVFVLAVYAIAAGACAQQWRSRPRRQGAKFPMQRVDGAPGAYERQVRKNITQSYMNG